MWCCLWHIRWCCKWRWIPYTLMSYPARCLWGRPTFSNTTLFVMTMKSCCKVTTRCCLGIFQWIRLTLIARARSHRYKKRNKKFLRLTTWVVGIGRRFVSFSSVDELKVAAAAGFSTSDWDRLFTTIEVGEPPLSGTVGQVHSIKCSTTYVAYHNVSPSALVFKNTSLTSSDE